MFEQHPSGYPDAWQRIFTNRDYYGTLYANARAVYVKWHGFSTESINLAPATVPLPTVQLMSSTWAK